MAATQQPCPLAQQTAADITGAFPVGFDPTTIIALIQGIIAAFTNCMQPVNAADAQAHVTAHFQGGAYDRGTQRIAAHQAKLAARKAGTRIDDKEALVAGIATLDRIRTSDLATVQAALDSVARTA